LNTELIAQELETLKADGELQPQAVVDYAKSHPNSELHKHFNWNVKEAANAYWLQQARYLICKCVVVHVEPHEPPKPIRVFFREGKPENEDEERAGGYVSTEAMLADPVQRRKLIVTILKRVLGNLNSYPIPEFKTLVALARKLLQKYQQVEEVVSK
jgi:hypothetical protein